MGEGWYWGCPGGCGIVRAQVWRAWCGGVGAGRAQPGISPPSEREHGPDRPDPHSALVWMRSPAALDEEPRRDIVRGRPGAVRYVGPVDGRCCESGATPTDAGEHHDAHGMVPAPAPDLYRFTADGAQIHVCGPYR